MAVVTAASVSTSIGGKILTFTDLTTGLGTVSSRILNIYDYSGNLVQTYNMGANLTQTYPITADQWLQFIEIIIDENGTYTVTKNYTAQGIVTATFLNIIKQVGCTCNCSNETFNELSVSDLFIFASDAFGIGGFPISSQQSITAANLYLEP